MTINSLPLEYQAEQQAIDRKRRMSDILLGQALQPLQATKAGRFTVAPSPLQALTKAVMGYSALQDDKEADKQSLDLAQTAAQRKSADMALLAQALSGRKVQPAGLYEDRAGNVTETPGLPAQTPIESITQAMPMLGSQMQPVALQALQGEQIRDENRQARLAERQLALDAQRAAGDRQEQLRRDLAAQNDQTRRDLAAMQQGNRNPIAVVGPDGKTPEYVSPDKAIGRQPWDKKNSATQLPAPALKMQNELLEEIGIAGSIKSDLAKLDGQLATGDLNVGPFSNLINRGRNVIGRSTPESQNFNTFQTTLERLRNDSLRLNKGVQTEGDAQRAWAELMGNTNDPAVVRKRLQEIQNINDRAITLKRMQIDQVRGNYGLEPMDVNSFSNPQTAITAAGATPGAAPGIQQLLDKYAPKNK